MLSLLMLCSLHCKVMCFEGGVALEVPPTVLFLEKIYVRR